MYYRHYTPLVVAWFAIVVSHAQTPLTNWANLNSKNTITHITHSDDHLYASTMGGIVQINKHTGEQHCIDHAQDGLPDNYVLSVVAHGDELWAANRFYGVSRHTAGGWTCHDSAEMGFAPTSGFRASPSTATLHGLADCWHSMKCVMARSSIPTNSIL